MKGVLGPKFSGGAVAVGLKGREGVSKSLCRPERSARALLARIGRLALPSGPIVVVRDCIVGKAAVRVWLGLIDVHSGRVWARIAKHGMFRQLSSWRYRVQTVSEAEALVVEVSLVKGRSQSAKLMTARLSGKTSFASNFHRSSLFSYLSTSAYS